MDFLGSILSQKTSSDLSILGKSEQRVIEIGCGYGTYLNVLNPSWDSYFGIDPNEFYCMYAKRIAKKLELKGEFIGGAAESLPFKDNSVDTIISTYTFSDFSSLEQLRAALTEILRVAKPDAQFIFCDISGGINDNYWKIQVIADMASGKSLWGLADLWIEIFSFLVENTQVQRIKRVKFVYNFSNTADLVERFKALTPAIATDDRVRKAIEKDYNDPILECEGLFLHATIKKN